MSLTEREQDAIAEKTAKALQRNRNECGDHPEPCLIYTNDPKVRKRHLDDHEFLSWFMGWVNPARKETKSFLIKGFVLVFFAIIAAIVYLATPLSLKGILK